MKLNKIFFILFIIFSFALPKGGIKLGSVPITWGYLFLLIAVPISLLSLSRNKEIITNKRVITLMLCLPFMLYSILVLPFKDIENVGFLFSFILSIIAMPVFFLLFFSQSIDQLDQGVFPKVFKWCLRFVIVFGVVKFGLQLFTTASLDIPYLTMNAGDVGMEDEKFNDRGGIFKLTSTFSNGNIYGICMLMLFPLYLKFEKNNKLKAVYILSLILTLSRTVWIGTLLYLFFYAIIRIKKKSTVFVVTGIITALVIVFPIFLAYIDRDITFIFDSDLGGRLGQLGALQHVTLLGESRFESIAEIVYLSIFNTFGLLGILFFLLYIFAPIIAYYFSNKIPRARSMPIILGCLVYTIIAASDGAMLYIPVMAYFWFVASYSLKKT